jgi:subtilisin family serine protease
MATKKRTSDVESTAGALVSTDAESLLLAALERGGDTSKTGRFLMTFKEGSMDAGVKHLESTHGLRLAHARDFKNQAVMLEEAGGADAVVFPDIHVALISGPAAEARSMHAEMEIAEDSPVLSVDPEYFVFAAGINPSDYMKGVVHTAQMIARDLGLKEEGVAEAEQVSPEVLGVTWGLNACKAPPSTRSGLGLKIAVLDTGFDLGHPEFAGRAFTTASFVGQPVQDLHGHGTHTTGTACGPKAPAGPIQRYGIAFGVRIFVGKVLTNSGSGTQAQVLAGMNWAVANRCEVISMSLGGPGGVALAYTSAGQAALNNGCLIIAAAGNAGPGPNTVGAPANSPTIVSVAAVDINLQPASFSSRGKVDIAGPGVNVFSSWPRPTLHNTISGTSMATPHVSGCAALWAQTSPSLRGVALRAKLFATARPLPFAASIVGHGLVQAPA